MMIGKEAVKTLDKKEGRCVEIVLFFKETFIRIFITALFEIVTLKIVMSINRKICEHIMLYSLHGLLLYSLFFHM